MPKYLLLIVLSGLLFSCKSKKVSLAENDEKVALPDLVEFFQPLKVPYAVTDTIFHRKESDSTVINYNLFTRLIPDTILTRLFGKESKPHLYAVGRISVPKEETYLFVKAVTKDRKVLYVLCLDHKSRLVGSRPVIYSDDEPGVSGEADMDAKYTLSILHQRKGSDGQLLYKKDAYIFNADAGGFMLILTEGNETKPKIMPVYNPIDTFPRKHKFSGDYAQDKRNFIAVRDGRDPSRFYFFVHFEKEQEDGLCKGELKGEARIVSPGIARYKSYSDPCAIEFSFGTSGVTMKELGGCGVHRDIKCFFEGYYERKHETKAKPAGKKSESPKA